jgi:uncharacterized NAD(P)/FAD-binding protein YdhS
MTYISFTSGEIMDLMSILSKKCDEIEDKDPHLASYYYDMFQQFEKILDKVQDFQPENRVANLILASN